MTVTAFKPRIPEKEIDVVEPGGRPRKGHMTFDLRRDLKFSTAGLESYAFARWEPVFREYAIAGTLHLDHLADMAESSNHAALKHHSALTSAALGMTVAETEGRLISLFERHAAEWNKFTKDLGARSFIKKWTRASQ